MGCGGGGGRKWNAGKVKVSLMYLYITVLSGFDGDAR